MRESLIHAGAGDDEITLDIARGSIFSEDGNDIIQVLGTHHYVNIYAGAGDDLIEFQGGKARDSEGDDPVIDLGTGSDTVRAGRFSDHITSDDGNDLIYGRDGNDWIQVNGGNDTIYGGAGDDTIFVTTGGQTIYGGAGEEQIIMIVDEQVNTDPDFGRGSLIVGGSGFSQINWNSTGDDTIRGGDGGSHILIKGGRDVIVTGKGQDFVATFEGSHVIRTNAGRDEINVSNGNNRVFAGAGDDQISFGYQSGKDTVTGGAGDDVFKLLVGTKQDVITDFGNGDDVMDLRGIQGKSFIGGDAFSGAQGEVRYDQTSGLLSGDKNGDGVADWSIRFANKVALTADDFLFA